MAMMSATDTGIQQIGETAGLVWHTLNDHGPLTLANLIKRVDAPRDIVLQGIGWLAREEKITIEDGRRGRMVELR